MDPVAEFNLVTIPLLGIVLAFQEQNEEEVQMSLSSKNSFPAPSLHCLYFSEMFLP